MTAWGILKPDDIPSARRLQSLGLTRAIRRFNESAVPGMGSLWFAMPLIWSMLGIGAARKLERRPIEVANAVEALLMKLALKGEDVDANDGRLRGRRNLPRVEWTFEALRKPGAYVTQPFRQTCNQPLVTLGLVSGTSARFNSFQLTHDGERLLGPLANVRAKIEAWVAGNKRIDWDVLNAILPAARLPDAVCVELTRRIYGAGPNAERRKTIRDLGQQLTSDGLLDTSPEGISQDHLDDLRGGIATVRLRWSAVQVLNAVEGQLEKQRNDGRTPNLALLDGSLGDGIRKRMDDCIAEAKRAEKHIKKAGEKESKCFLKDCLDKNNLLKCLVKRDGVVIVLRDDVLVPGPAFGADAVAQDDRTSLAHGVPELPRIANLLSVTDDLSPPKTPASVRKVAE